jgi:hypothetical protein
LGLLPPARRALATHAGDQGYQIDQVCDAPYDGPCGDPCGPSVTCSSETGWQCCVTDSSNHFFGWHKNGGAGAVFQLRPNECVGSTSTPGTAWDGWAWHVPNCNGCNDVKFRCHDGKHCNSSGGNCTPDICKKQTGSTGCT